MKGACGETRELDARARLGRERLDPPLELVGDRDGVGVVAAEGLDRHDRAQRRGRARAHGRAVVGRVDERRHARAQALGGAELRHRVQPVGPETAVRRVWAAIQGPNARPSPRPA